MRLDQCFVGSCANGTLEDLATVAAIVGGKQVASGVRFIVTPGSQRIYREAAKLGIIATLIEAGCLVTPSACGACAGLDLGVLGPGEVCLTASTRNFKGRMGSPEAKIYIGSTATVGGLGVDGADHGSSDHRGMTMTLVGRVWKFGDHVNTDLIMPMRAISLPRRERPRWAFSADRPGWASEVRPGDVIVAGENFGTGSSRPAAEVLKDLGIACVLAETINGLFFRNCVQLRASSSGGSGRRRRIRGGRRRSKSFSRAARSATGVAVTELRGEPWPPMLLDVLSAGGLVPLLENRGLLLAE